MSITVFSLNPIEVNFSTSVWVNPATIAGEIFTSSLDLLSVAYNVVQDLAVCSNDSLSDL